MTVPDMCNTIVGPAVSPLPYPNLGMPPSAVPTALNVIISGGLALTMDSMVEPTNGDEPGITGGGGLVSAEIMGAVIIMSSMTVMIEGMPAGTTEHCNNERKQHDRHWLHPEPGGRHDYELNT